MWWYNSCVMFNACYPINRSDDVPEDLLQQHRDVIVQWLDDLLQDYISVDVLFR